MSRGQRERVRMCVRVWIIGEKKKLDPIRVGNLSALTPAQEYLHIVN